MRSFLWMFLDWIVFDDFDNLWDFQLVHLKISKRDRGNK